MPAILVRATPRPALSTTKLLLLVLVILGSIYAAAVVLYCSVRLARYVLGKIGWLDIVEAPLDPSSAIPEPEPEHEKQDLQDLLDLIRTQTRTRRAAKPVTEDLYSPQVLHFKMFLRRMFPGRRCSAFSARRALAFVPSPLHHVLNARDLNLDIDQPKPSFIFKLRQDQGPLLFPLPARNYRLKKGTKSSRRAAAAGKENQPSLFVV